MLFELFKSVQVIPLSPLFLLVGEDAFLRKKLRDSLIERALAPGLREMNLSRFYGGEEGAERAVDACLEYPCFAERRVVLFLQADKMKKKEMTLWPNYFANPQLSTILILEAEKLDGRFEWVKSAKKHGTVLEIPEPTGGEVLSWVHKCFSREGKKTTQDVMLRMVEWIGTSFSALQQAVIQLSLFVGEVPEVKLEDVETLLVKVSEENVFALLDDLSQGRGQGGHRSLDRLLEAGEPPLRLLALLYRQIGILLALKFEGIEATQRLFRISPYALKKYENQVRTLGKKIHYGLLRPLAEADQELKGSPLAPTLVFKRCLEEVGVLLS